MSSITLNVNTDKLDRKWPLFQRILTNLPQNFVSDGAEIVESQMRIEIPKGQSGRLEGSVYSQVNGNTAIIATATGYGKAVDEGRRGFHVEAKLGGVLRFFVGGKIIFRKWSNPGPAPANNFKQRTIENSILRMGEKVDQRTKSELANL